MCSLIKTLLYFEKRNCPHNFLNMTGQEMTIATPTGVKVLVKAVPEHTTLAIPGGVVNHPIQVTKILKVNVTWKGNYSTNVDWEGFKKLANANGMDFLFQN